MIAATQSNHPLAAVPQATDVLPPLEQAFVRLRGAEMRVTKPRIAILETLIKRQAPASIEQIHQDLAHKSCDLVTVYRCLAAFESVGLVRRSFSPNGTNLYEIGINNPQRYHIVCKSCGKAEPVDYFPVEGMERMLKDHGYTQVSHLVEFFGVCPGCQQKIGGRLAGAPANPAHA